MKLRLPKLLKNALLSCFAVTSMATTIASGATLAESKQADLGNVMYIGDSITHGISDPSYRWSLFKILADNGIGQAEKGVVTGNDPNYIAGGFASSALYGGHIFQNIHSANSSARAYEVSGRLAPKNGRFGGSNIENWLGQSTEKNDGSLYPVNPSSNGSIGSTFTGNNAPGTYFIMLGTNDLLSDNGANVEDLVDAKQALLIGTTADDGVTWSGGGDMDTILESIRLSKSDASVTIASIPCWAAAHPTTAINTSAEHDAVAGYNSNLEKWAKANNVYYIDVNKGLVDVASSISFCGVTSFFLPDRLHPTAQGNLIIAGNIAKASGYAGRTAGQLRKASTDFIKKAAGTIGTITLGSQTTAAVNETIAWTGAGDVSKGYTLDFQVRVGNSGTALTPASWNTANPFAVTFGNGVTSGTLNINEAYIQWGNTILYSMDMSTNMESLRISYVKGSSSNNLAGGFYVWLGDMLIGEALSSTGNATDGVILTYAGDEGFTLESLSMEGGSWAPNTSLYVNPDADSHFLVGTGNASNSGMIVWQTTGFTSENNDLKASSGVYNARLGSGGSGSQVGITITGAVNNASTTGNIYANQTAWTGDIWLTLNTLTTQTSWYGGQNNGTLTGNIYVRFMGDGVYGSNQPTTGSAFFGAVNDAARVTGNVYLELSADNLVFGSFTAPGYSIMGTYAATIDGSFTVVVNAGNLTKGILGGAMNGTQTCGGGTYIFVNGGTIGVSSNSNASIVGGGHTGGTINKGSHIAVSGGQVSGNIYGGGIAGTVNGGSNISLSGGQVFGNIYGGGTVGTVNGGSAITIDGKSLTSSALTGNIYGGSNGAGAVADGSTITISNFVEGSLAYIATSSSIISGAGAGAGAVTGTKTLNLADVHGELAAQINNFNRVLLTGNTEVSLTGTNTALSMLEIGRDATLSLSDFAKLGGATLTGTGTLALTGTSIVLTSQMLATFSGIISVTGSNVITISSALYYGLGVDRFQGELGVNILLSGGTNWIAATDGALDASITTAGASTDHVGYLVGGSATEAFNLTADQVNGYKSTLMVGAGVLSLSGGTLSGDLILYTTTGGSAGSLSILEDTTLSNLYSSTQTGDSEGMPIVGPFGSGGGATTISIASGKTLTVAAGQYNGSITGAGSLSITGMVSLGGAISQSGQTILQTGATLVISAGTSVTNGKIAFNGGTLMYGEGVQKDLSANIALSGANPIKIDLNGTTQTWATALHTDIPKLEVSSTIAGGSLTFSQAYTAGKKINVFVGEGASVVQTGTFSVGALTGSGSYEASFGTDVTAAYAIDASGFTGNLTVSGTILVRILTTGTATNRFSLTLNRESILVTPTASAATLYVSDFSGTGNFRFDYNYNPGTATGNTLRSLDMEMTHDNTWSGSWINNNGRSGSVTVGSIVGECYTFTMSGGFKTASTSATVGLTIGNVAGTSKAIAKFTGDGNWTAPIAINTGSTLMYAGNSVAHAAIISGAGGLLVELAASSNILTFSGANTFSGGTVVTAGTFKVAHASAAGTGGISLVGGTLEVAVASFSSVLNVGAESSGFLKGANLDTYTSGINISGGGSLSLAADGGTSAQVVTMSGGSLVMGAYSNARTINATGTNIISGTAYSGTINNSGSLSITGTLGAGATIQMANGSSLNMNNQGLTSTVQIAANATATLSGLTGFAGNISLAEKARLQVIGEGGLSLAEGSSLALVGGSAFFVGDLHVNGGILSFGLNSGVDMTARLALEGSLTLGSNLAGLHFSILNGTSLASGIYTLISTTEGILGMVDEYPLDKLLGLPDLSASRQSFSVELGGVDGKDLVLVVSGEVANLTWINDNVNGVWKTNDSSLTGLWSGGSSDKPYYLGGDTVSFNDSSTTQHTITLEGELASGGTTIEAGLWDFTGTGSLIGLGALTINGGTLSLGDTTHYNYTGGTFLNGGTLLLNGGVFDVAPTITFGGGTLAFGVDTDISAWTFVGTQPFLLNVQDSVVVTAAALIGDRSLELSGEGVLVINNQVRVAAQTITVNKGATLRIVAGSATDRLDQGNIFAGSGTIEFDLASSQVQTFNASNSFTGSWKLTQGVVRLNSDGMGIYTEKKADAIIMNGGMLRISGEFGANVGFTFTKDSEIDATGTLTIQGDMVGGFKLTKTGSGNLILNGDVSTASIEMGNGGLSSNKAGGWLYTGAFNVTGNVTLGVANGSLMTFSGASSLGDNRTLNVLSEVRLTGAITATGTLTVNGAGKFIFDRYEGATTLGTLSVLGQNVEIARDITLTELLINVMVSGNPLGQPASKLTIASGATVSTGLFTLGYTSINRDSFLDVYGSLTVTGTTNVIFGNWNGAQSTARVYQGGSLEILNTTLILGDGGMQGTRPSVNTLIVEGLAKVKTIDLGVGNAGTSTLTLSDGGEIRIGSGGIVKTTPASARVTVINLNGGTLGTMSLSDGGSGYTGWSSSLAMNMLSATTGTTFDAGETLGITLSGALTGVGKLNKTGAGILTLTGVNTFSGGVVLSGGSLIANTGSGENTSFGKSTSMTMSGGASADILVTNDMVIENAVATNLTINSNGKHLLTLSGTFNAFAGVGGNVTLGNLDLAIAGKGKVGGITAVNLSITSGTTLFFDLADHTSPREHSDFITVSGDLTFTGVAGANTIMVNPLMGLGTGSYLLIQTGLATMDMSHWVLAGLSANGTRQTFNLGNEEIRGSGTSTGNVYLHVAGEAAILSWAGLGDDVWDRALSGAENDADWTAPDGVSLPLGTKFHNLDQVQFLGDGAGDVNLKGELNPASILVNNAAGADYVFQTTVDLDGSIAGDTTSLIKEGAGKLSLNLANTYGGGTTLKGGTLAIGDANALGAAGFFGTAGYIDIQGGTLDLQVANVVLSGKVSGDAVLTGSATGSFTGTLSLDTGVLSVGNLDLLGAGAILHFNGGALSLNASGDISGKSFTASASAGYALFLDGVGTIIQAGSSLLNKTVDLAGAGTLVYGSNDAKLAVNSTISISGKDAASILAVWASGDASADVLGVTLSAADYEGSIQLNSGVIIANGSTLRAGANVILNGGGITVTNTLPAVAIDWAINLGTETGNFLRVYGSNSLTINGSIGTDLDAATLNLQDGGFLILGSAATIEDAITLNFAGATKLRLADHAGNRTLTNTVSFAANATLGGGTNVGDMIFAGDVKVIGNRTVAVNSNVFFTGTLGGDTVTAEFYKSGSGMLTLQNTNIAQFSLLSSTGGGTLMIKSAVQLVSLRADAANIEIAEGSTVNISGDRNENWSGNAGDIASNSFTMGNGNNTFTMSGGTVNALLAEITKRDSNLTINFTGGTANLKGINLTRRNGAQSHVVTFDGSTVHLGTSGLVLNGRNATTTTYLVTGTLGSLGATWSSSSNMILGKAGSTVNDFTFNTSQYDSVAKTYTTNASTITLSGILSNFDADNYSNIIKTGVGTLVLSGVNTFSGTVSVQQGTLSINNIAALGTGTSAISMATGTTLKISYTGATTMEFGRDLHGSGYTLSLAGGATGTVKWTNTGEVNLEKMMLSYVGTTRALREAGTPLFEMSSGTITISSAGLGSGTMRSENTGGVLFTEAALTIAGTGTSEFKMTGGTLNVLNGTVRFQQDGTGFFTMNGSAAVANVKGLDMTSTIKTDTWYACSAILNLNQGVLNIGDRGIVRDTSGSTLGVSTINLSGGTLGALASWTSAVGMTATADTTTTINTQIWDAVAKDYTSNGATITLSQAVTGSGNIRKTGLGSLILSADNTATGKLTVEEGIVQLGAATASATGTWAGAVELYASAQLIVNHSNAFSLAGIISGDGSLVKNAAENLTLTGANSYAGGTTINAGTVTAGHLSALGTGAISLAGLAADSRVSFNASTFAVANAITLEAGKFGSVSGAEYVGHITTAGDLTLGSALGATATISLNGGTLAMGAHAVSNTITMGANAIATVSGTAYTGAIHAEGQLTVTDTLTSTASVHVAQGKTLSLTSTTYTGTLNMQGNLNIGVGTAVATLSTGSITTGASSILNYNLASATSYDMLTATGALALDAGTTFNLILAEGYTLSHGSSFTVMTGIFAGWVAGSSSFNVTLNSLTSDAWKYRWSYDGTSLVLTLQDKNVPMGLTWNGGVDGVWSVGGAGWLESGLFQETYADNLAVTFMAAEAGTVTIAEGGVSPLSIDITGGAYTFTGGAITGGSLSITGGSLSLENANTSVGAMSIAAGASLSLSGAAGTWVGAIANSGTLIFNHTGDFSFGTVVTGTGGAEKLGSHTLTLNSSVTVSNFYVKEGTLALGATGSITGTISIGSGVLGAGRFELSSESQYNALTGDQIVMNGGTLSIGLGLSNSSSLDLAKITAGGTGSLEFASGQFITPGNGSSHLTGLGIVIKDTAQLTIAGGDWTNDFFISGTGSWDGTTDTARLVLGAGVMSGTVHLTGDASIGIATGVGGGTIANLNGANHVLNKLGEGNLTIGNLTGSLSALNVTAGVVSLRAIAAGQSITTINLSDNTQLEVINAGDMALSAITGTGALYKSGAGNLTLSGINTYTEMTMINGGTLTLAAGTSLGTASISLVKGTLDMGSNALNHAINVGVVGGAQEVSYLNNATAYTGALSIDGGTLFLNSLLGSAASINLGAGILNAGALALTNVITSSGSATLSASGFVGTLNITRGTLSLSSDLGGTAAMTINLLGGSLDMGSHNSQRGILVTGTGSLSGADNFTGALTVNTDGAFTLGSALAAGSAIQFQKGTLDFGGIGAIGRDLHVTGAGDHTLINNAGYTGNITLGGNLTVANLSLGSGQSLTLEGSHTLTGSLNLSGGTINFDFNGTTGEKLNLTGDLIVSSASTLDINLTGNPLAQGDVLHLMTIGGGIGPAGDWRLRLTVEINAGRLLGELSMSGNTLIYTVNTVKNLYWKDGNGDWTQSTGIIGEEAYNELLPWLVNKGMVDDNRFFDKDAAVFDGLGGTATITNTITAGSILVDSSSAYSFVNSTGKLSGTGSLTKKGSGTLTITGTNDYRGNTILEAGTIHVMSQGALGGGSLVFSGGTLQVGTDYTLGAIGGTGTVNLMVDKDKALRAGSQLSDRIVSFSSGDLNNSGSLILTEAVTGGQINLDKVHLFLNNTASTSAITTVGGNSILQQASAYNGEITVNLGTGLIVIGDLKASKITLNWENGRVGTLVFNANEDATLTSALYGGGVIDYSIVGSGAGGGTLTINTTVANQFDGTLLANNGDIKFNQAGSSSFAAMLDIRSSRTITYTGNTLGANATSVNSLVGVSGAGTLRNSGAGILVAQSVGFTGDIIVDKGSTLQLIADWTFGSGQELTLNGEVWMYNPAATSLSFNAGSTLNLQGALRVGTTANNIVDTINFGAGSNLISSATAMIDLTFQANGAARAQIINFNFNSDQSYAGGIKAIGGVVNVNMSAGKTLSFTSHTMGLFKGSLNISSGTVKLSGSAALDNTDVAINLRGGSLDFSNDAVAYNANTITVTGSGSVLTGAFLAAGYQGEVEINGGLTLGAGMNAKAKLNLNAGGSLDMAAQAVASTLTVTGAASLSNNANFTGNVDFTTGSNLTVSNLQMNSGQSLTLDGAATLTGNLSLNGGSLTFDANDVLTISGNLIGIGSSETVLTVVDLSNFAEGEYVLMNIGGSIMNIPTGKLILAGQTGRSLANLSQTEHSIVLNVQGKADSLDWSGSDGTWTQSTGQAHSGLGWHDAGSAWTVDGVGSDNKFYADDAVEFKGAGATVTISGTVNPGSMLVSAGDFIFNNAGEAGSGIAGSGALSITNGSLTMNGANSAWTGATSLTGGSLILGNVDALGSGKLTYSSGSFGIAAGIEFTLTSSNFALATDSTAVTLDVEGTLNADSSVLGGTAAITTTGAGTLNLTLTENRTAAITNTGILNVINNGIGEISVGNLSGGTINIKGTGTIATTQTDLVATVDGGNLSLKMDGSAGNITLNNGAQLILAAVGSFSTTVTLTGTTNTLSSTADVTLSGNIIGAGDLNVAGGNNVALTGGFALGTLNILGSTNVTLGGANQSLTGISVEGTLNINGALSLGIGGITGTGAVNMAAAALTATGDFSIANAVSLTNSSTLNTGAHDVIFAGALTGTGSLTKSGAGKLTLSSALTNANINLAEGSLDMAGSAATLRLTVDATRSATLENADSLNDASTVNIAGTLTTTGNVAGTLTLQGGGQLNLAGAMTNVVHVEGASTLNQQAGSWKSLKLASNANLTYQHNGIASALSLASGQKITAAQGATINGSLSFDGGTFSLNMAGFNKDHSMVNINGALSINSLTTIDLRGLELQGGSKNILTLFTGTSDFVLDTNLLQLTGIDGLPVFSYDWSKSGNSLILTLNLSNQLIWTGGKNNNWSYDSSDLNWDLGGAESQFHERDYVVFDGSASDSARDITLVNDVTIGTLKPTSMTVSGDKDYSFGGTGSMTVKGKMFKKGSGSVTFQNDGENRFNGGMVLEAGIVNIAGNSSVIAALDTEGQLNITSSKESTFTEMQGAGNILIDSSTGGGAHLSSLAQGDYTGRVTIKQGSLTNDKALGAAKLDIEASGHVVLSGVTGSEVGSLSTTTGAGRISGITGDVRLGTASFVLDSSSWVGSADFSGPIVTQGTGSNLTLDRLELTITADFLSSMDLNTHYSFALTDGILGGAITQVDPYWNSLLNVSFLGVNRDLYAMTLDGGTITVMWSDMKDHLYVQEDGSMMPNPSKPVSADELAKFKAVTVNGLLNIGSGNDTDLVLNNLNGNSELGNIVVKKGTSLTLHSDGSDRRDAYLGTITTNGVALVKTGTGTQILGSQLSTAGNVTVQEGSLEFFLGVTAKEIMVLGSSNLNVAGDLIASKFTLESSATATISGSLASVAVLSLEDDSSLHLTGKAPSRVESLTMTGNSTLELAKESWLEITKSASFGVNTHVLGEGTLSICAGAALTLDSSNVFATTVILDLAAAAGSSAGGSLNLGANGSVVVGGLSGAGKITSSADATGKGEIILNVIGDNTASFEGILTTTDTAAQAKDIVGTIIKEGSGTQELAAHGDSKQVVYNLDVREGTLELDGKVGYGKVSIKTAPQVSTLQASVADATDEVAKSPVPAPSTLYVKANDKRQFYSLDMQRDTVLKFDRPTSGSTYLTLTGTSVGEGNAWGNFQAGSTIQADVSSGMTLIKARKTGTMNGILMGVDQVKFDLNLGVAGSWNAGLNLTLFDADIYRDSVGSEFNAWDTLVNNVTLAGSTWGKLETSLVDGKVKLTGSRMGANTPFEGTTNSANSQAGAEMIWDLNLNYFKTTGKELNATGTELGNVLTSLAMMGSGTEATNTLLAAVAGSTVTALAGSQRADFRQQQDWIRNRTTGMGISPNVVHEDLPYVNGWIQANGGTNRVSAEGHEAGYDLNTFGGTFGFDVDMSAKLTWGFAFTANYNKLTATGAESAKGRNDAYYANLFVRTQNKRWANTFIITGGWNDAKLDRTVGHLLGSYTARGTTQGSTIGAMYETTYDIPINENETSVFQPLLNVSFSNASMDAYKEEGAGNAGLNVDSTDSTYGTVAVGARLLGTVGTGLFGRASLGELRLQVAQDFGDDTNIARVGLGGIQRDVVGVKVGKTALQIGAGISVPVTEKGSLYFDLNTDFRSKATSVNGSIGYRINF